MLIGRESTKAASKDLSNKSSGTAMQENGRDMMVLGRADYCHSYSNGPGVIIGGTRHRTFARRRSRVPPFRVMIKRIMT